MSDVLSQVMKKPETEIKPVVAEQATPVPSSTAVVKTRTITVTLEESGNVSVDFQYTPTLPYVTSAELIRVLRAIRVGWRSNLRQLRLNSREPEKVAE